MSTTLEQAFKHFVELLEQVDEVQYVVAFEDAEADFFTYISSPDHTVYSRIHDAEIVITEEYPDLAIDFHVRYLQGRSIETFVPSLPPLAYAKEAGD